MQRNGEYAVIGAKVKGQDAMRCDHAVNMTNDDKSLVEKIVLAQLKKFPDYYPGL
jgi:hypothetical protein